jgi:uncharacterized membrane protein
MTELFVLTLILYVFFHTWLQRLRDSDLRLALVKLLKSNVPDYQYSTDLDLTLHSIIIIKLITAVYFCNSVH